MKKNIGITLIKFLLIILTIFVIEYNKSKKYFTDNMVVNYSLSSILEEQEKINHEIEKYARSSKYTIDNPKVILNPYKISPLTALIIFKTDDLCSISVNVNDEYIFEMEKSRKHIIPIYGMYEDKINMITLKIGDNRLKEIEIITNKASNVNSLDVNKAIFDNYNDLYFMTSPVGTSASAYDQNGNLKWYLTERFTMDFEWLDNGHFLVGIPNASVGDRKIGFVEIDYLGKIYNYYVLEHGYEFEFQVLSNGNYMLCGGDKPVFYDKAWIYEIDSTTGEMINYIDLYQIFKEIDSDFDSNRLNYRIIRNSFYYNENTGEILISLRGLNSVVSVDYIKKKINYIFAPAGIYSEKFDEYLVSLDSGRFPLGIHSVFMTEEGYIGFINNGYDRFNGFEVGGEDRVSLYKDAYSSAEIYSIVDKKARLIWSYDGGKDIFTHQYGSFNIYNGKKLINFGWTLEDDYRNKQDSTLSDSEKNTDNTYAKIIEFNENDEVLFDAKIADGKYRIFKHFLYEKNIDNFDYEDSSFNITVPPSDIEKIYTTSIEKELDSAILFENKISYTKFSIDTDYIFDEYDEAYILLVDKYGKSYKITYKEEQNNVIKSLNIDLKKGEYALYLIINNVYFKTNIKVIY